MENKETMMIAWFSAAMITWIVMYVNERLFDEPMKKSTYIKNIVFAASLVTGFVYMTMNYSQVLESVPQENIIPPF